MTTMSDETLPEADQLPISTHDNRNSSIIGALTAGGRSIVYQMTTFYLRTPLKLFRPARFDYLHYVRIVLTGEEKNSGSHNDNNSKKRHFFLRSRYFNYLENSSLGILTKALNKYGWRVIPDRILPPLVANSATGVVLYTTYLTTLNHFSGDLESKSSLQNPWNVWRSGFLAGAMQAFVSTPIDAIYTRSSTSELLSSAKKYDNLWFYGRDKLREIGLIGCFGGFGIALIKESLGFAVYFTTFEMVKGQLCYWFKGFLKQYAEVKYTLHNMKLTDILPSKTPSSSRRSDVEFMTKKEEKWLNRAFIFIGGVTAAFLLQVVQYPFKKVQKIHQSRLEAFDIMNRPSAHQSQKSLTNLSNVTKIWVSAPASRRLHIYYNSYLDTIEHIYFIHRNTNSLKWLYKGFARSTLAIIPGTTAGLLLLDYMRSSFEQSFPQQNEQLSTQSIESPND